MFFIKKQLGFGSVSIQDKKQKTHCFRVRDKQGFLKLIPVYNGNLYTTKKTNQFKAWLDAFNQYYNSSVALINKTSDPTLNSGWLSGFTDAEGCFTVSVVKRSEKSNQVFVRFVLSQQEEFDLMTKIADLFGGKLHYLKSYNGYNMVVNLTKLRNVIRYFDSYTLKTKKHIDYLN